MRTKNYFNICRLIVVSCMFWFSSNQVSAQFCDSLTPTFNVDLSAAPNMSWISPIIARDGSCCGSVNPDKCLEFVITLNPNSAAIVFNFASGAVPPGALFYQIDCGPATPVGSPICLTGVGPFHLTFCKPGNNSNSFSIETIPNPIFGPNLTLGDGCSDELTVQFYDEASITWTSISPGAAGTYNSFLACTAGCDTNLVTGSGNPPALVQYLVCGTALNGCVFEPVCDTMSATFLTPLSLTIQTPDSVLCYNETSTVLTAVPSGGSGTYTYLWSNGSTSAAITAIPGTYSVSVQDATACAQHTAQITVTQLPAPNVGAGPSQNVCSTYIGAISLSGTASNTSGIIWTGNGGTFSPDSLSLNTSYTPSPGEINSGTVNVGIQSNDSSGCPSVSDATSIAYLATAQSVNISTQDVSCFGSTNGSALVSASGPQAPFTYSFDGAPYTATNLINGLAPGSHTVSVLSSLGCDSVITFIINEPPLLVLQEINHADVLCNGNTTGSSTVQANGGVGTYTYVWNTTPIQNGVLASNLAAGTYQVTVTDANGCNTPLTISITEPAPLTLQFDAVPPSCFGLSNGAVSSVVTGGVGSYNYLWSTGSVGTSIYSVAAGTYSLTVSDSNGCQISLSETIVEPTQLVVTGSNDSIICPNSTIGLTVNAQGGTGTYTYVWTPAAPNSNQISVAPSTNQTYTCTVQDNNGCIASDTINIATFFLDPADILVSAADSIICIKDSTMLTGVYTGSDPTVTLAWSHCPTCGASTSVNPTTNTTYTITATNQCGQQISANVTVAVSLPPTVALDPNGIELCPGEYFAVHNLSVNDTTFAYTWTFSDGYVTHDMTAIHSFAAPGNYTVSLSITNQYGCTSESNASEQIIVHPQAVADFNSSALELTTLDPTFDFTNLSTNSNLYEWHFGDGESASTFNATHTYTEYGDFTVTLNVNNQFNCPDQTQLTITVKPSFDIYVPNTFTPDGDAFNGVFLVQGYGILDEGFIMEIFNRWGEMVYYTTDLYNGWDGTYKGNTDIVQDGVYTWKVQFKDLTSKTHQKYGHVNVLK